jgi:RNase P subunit RPR2
MFSTYCPTCETEVLLGTRSIVHFPGTGGPDAVLLRCSCGTVVTGDARRPEPVEQPLHPELAEAS